MIEKAHELLPQTSLRSLFAQRRRLSVVAGIFLSTASLSETNVLNEPMSNTTTSIFHLRRDWEFTFPTCVKIHPFASQIVQIIIEHKRRQKNLSAQSMESNAMIGRPQTSPPLPRDVSVGPYFSGLGTFLMVMYLLSCIVVLLNILIAQLSDTYQNIQGDAQRRLALNRAWIISRVELKSGLIGKVRDVQ